MFHFARFACCALIVVTFSRCSGTTMSGSSGVARTSDKPAPPPKAEASGASKADDEVDTLEEDAAETEPSDDDKEEAVLEPEGPVATKSERTRLDYVACVGSPTGKGQNYKRSPRCQAESAVVVVNDGVDAFMICCPLPSGVLTSDPAKQFVERAGTCGSNEVATGIKDGKTSTMLCSELANGYEAGASSASLRIQEDDSTLPADLAALADAAEAGDTCICGENGVVIGGHVYRDNVCGERCVEIRRK